VPFNREATRRVALKVCAGAAAVPLLGMVAATAAETDYPARPVRVIVPYPAGGGADTVSRILLAKLSDGLGQQFVIENRGGAGGTIGAAVAAKAERDGYTVLYDATAFSVNPSLYARLPYDTLNDFQPVFLASLVPNLLVVHPSVEAKTVEDVIAIAKAAPGGLDWASSGNGTVQHLSLELFRLRTGVKLNHIPYRGGGPALNDLIGGQVKFFFSNGAASIGHIQSGALRAIAHTGRGTAAHSAGHSSRRGDAAGVRGLRMERRLRTCRNPCPDRRQAQCGLERGIAAAGGDRSTQRP
jgi:tripartite-type tricarboxylate transporter receptor subunit TctC